MDAAERREWTNEGGPERLDRALAAAWNDLSRSRLQALIREGRVSVEGTTATDPSQKLATGSNVVLDLPPPAPAEPVGEAIALSVVFVEGEAEWRLREVGGPVVPDRVNTSGATVDLRPLRHPV